MDYLHLFESFGKGKKADARRREYWEQYEPYCFLLDDATKTAYSVNRHYKKLGQPRGTNWIQYPDYTRQIWLYSGSNTPPFYYKKDCITYINKVDEIKRNYTIKSIP